MDTRELIETVKGKRTSLKNDRGRRDGGDVTSLSTREPVYRVDSSSQSSFESRGHQERQTGYIVGVRSPPPPTTNVDLLGSSFVELLKFQSEEHETLFTIVFFDDK